jgi:hypothetical protein
MSGAEYSFTTTEEAEDWSVYGPWKVRGGDAHDEKRIRMRRDAIPPNAE